MDKHRVVSQGQSESVVERLLTYREVAEILGVTDRTVWELVRKQELRNVRVGRSVRVDPADLRRYIDASKSSVGDPVG